jgi:hypothetical protein
VHGELLDDSVGTGTYCSNRANHCIGSTVQKLDVSPLSFLVLGEGLVSGGSATRRR